MRTLALDHGTRRIGVAVSDPLGVLAQPLETISRSDALPGAEFARIAELIEEYEVSRVVVGLPLHMDGRAGTEAEAARAFGARVAERTGVSVEFIDERWTTREADRALRESGHDARRRRGRSDAVAASLILRTYLARKPA